MIHSLRFNDDNNDNLYTLEKISIPFGVTETEHSQYAFCSSLESMEMRKSALSKLKAGTFQGCLSLKNVMLPESIRSIGAYAFENCTSLEHLILPDGLEHIGEGAFQGSALHSVTIPGTVRELGPRLFTGCKYLSKVILEPGITEIGREAFQFCCAETITIPNTVTRIDPLAFAGAHIRKLELPPQLCELGWGAFENCLFLRSATFPEMLREIPAFAFIGCLNLSRVSFSEGLIGIGESAFLHTDLETVTIPASVKLIETGAFLDVCYGRVTFKAGSSCTIETDAFDD